MHTRAFCRRGSFRTRCRSSGGARTSPRVCGQRPAAHECQRQGGGRRGTHLRRSAKTLGWRSQCGRRRRRPRRERRRFPCGTQSAPRPVRPRARLLGQSSRAERSKAPGRMMRPGASAVSSSAPVSFRQGRSAQPGRRRFCPFAASAASRPPSRRYVSGAAPVFMRTSAGRTGSYRSPSGTRLRPRCPDPDCAGRSGRRSRR